LPILTPLSLLALLLRPPPPSTLFPYTTLFRSPPGGRLRRGTAGPLGSPPRLRSPGHRQHGLPGRGPPPSASALLPGAPRRSRGRSEEHTSELQSRENLVCRLLLEKKKKTTHMY